MIDKEIFEKIFVLEEMREKYMKDVHKIFDIFFDVKRENKTLPEIYSELRAFLESKGEEERFQLFFLALLVMSVACEVVFKRYEAIAKEVLSALSKTEPKN